MARVQRFEDLEVWKLAREIASEIYRLSSVEPFFKDFGLYVAMDQGYILEDDFRRIYGKAVECSRAVSGLIKYLRQSELKGRKFS